LYSVEWKDDCEWRFEKDVACLKNIKGAKKSVNAPLKIVVDLGQIIKPATSRARSKTANNSAAMFHGLWHFTTLAVPRVNGVGW
jgi:hypothetical protein